jgi:hypothetical protein
MAEEALGIAGLVPVAAKVVVDWWKAARSYEGDIKELRELIDTLSGMLERLRDSGFLQQGGKAPENLGRKLDHLRGILEKYSDRGSSGKPSKWKKAPKKFLHVFQGRADESSNRNAYEPNVSVRMRVMISC